jgi:uncharacterized membrane protein
MFARLSLNNGATLMKLVLLANLAATLMMTGAIWIVQVVHYPLFSRVGAEGFARYEAEHSALITLIVGPLMLAEAFTAFLLAMQPPENVSYPEVWIGLGLVAVVWLVTFFVSVPQHSILAGGFDQGAYETLVNTNWWRTLAWTARSALVLWMTVKVIGVERLLS